MSVALGKRSCGMFLIKFNQKTPPRRRAKRGVVIHIPRLIESCVMSLLHHGVDNI